MSFAFFPVLPVVFHQVTFLIKSLTFPPIVCRTKSTHSRPDLVVDRIAHSPRQSHEQFPEPMTMFFIQKNYRVLHKREEERRGPMMGAEEQSQKEMLYAWSERQEP